MKKVLNKVLYLPLMIMIIVMIFWIYYRINENPKYESLSHLDSNLEAYKITINQINTTAQFLIAMGTALFGVCGYFIKEAKKYLNVIPVAVPYFISLILLGFSYKSAFQIYETLINNLSYGEVGFRPGNSLTFYYLKEEYILCSGVSLSLLSILAITFIFSTNKSTSNEN